MSMIPADYHNKDLKLARRHVRRGARRIARQEIVIGDLHREGSPVDLANELLGRICNRQREQLDRLKLIEAMVDSKL